ncbi:fumarylacetoacetate hydrolase family protein, partial [uncultured Pseudoalteromonas sp.]|uniref:fumarylacetoacetate hydrolase family protein n=1 Tax=uncultured Pseudoalteromonas sp. TaxID=114053 RepID=UPI0025964417
MKIICIDQNYSDHIKELNSKPSSEPMFFLKPDSAVLLKKHPFVIPEFTNEVHYEVELLVRINRLGKYIQPKFAHKYYDEIGLGIDFTARDLQRECKEKGHPWEKAKGFDGSAVLGDTWISKENYKDLKDKIIHLVIEEQFPDTSNPWKTQAFQREFIFNGLNSAKPEDYIMFSDPDEIPHPETLA